MSCDSINSSELLSYSIQTRVRMAGSSLRICALRVKAARRYCRLGTSSYRCGGCGCAVFCSLASASPLSYPHNLHISREDRMQILHFLSLSCGTHLLTHSLSLMQTERERPTSAVLCSSVSLRRLPQFSPFD